MDNATRKDIKRVVDIIKQMSMFQSYREVPLNERMDRLNKFLEEDNTIPIVKINKMKYTDEFKGIISVLNRTAASLMAKYYSGGYSTFENILEYELNIMLNRLKCLKIQEVRHTDDMKLLGYEEYWIRDKDNTITLMELLLIPIYLLPLIDDTSYVYTTNGIYIRKIELDSLDTKNGCVSFGYKKR